MISSPHSVNSDVTPTTDQARSHTLLIGALPPSVGGVTMHCARALNALRAAGIDAHLANPRFGRSQNPDEASGVAAWRLIMRARRQGWPVFVEYSAANALRRALRMLALTSLIRRSQLALVPHSGGFPADVQQTNVAGRIHRYLVRRASLVLCLSTAIDAAVKEVAPNASRHRAASFILDEHVEAAKARADARRVERDPVIVTSGYRTQIYQYEQVIDMWRQIREDHPDTELHIYAYGSTVDDSWTEVLARAHAEGVKVFVDTPSEEFLDALSCAAIYVRNTTHDSYGVAVAEALYLGTPAVATAVCERPPGASIYDLGDVVQLERLVSKSLHSDGAGPAHWGDNGAAAYVSAIDLLALT